MDKFEEFQEMMEQNGINPLTAYQDALRREMESQTGRVPARYLYFAILFHQTPQKGSNLCRRAFNFTLKVK